MNINTPQTNRARAEVRHLMAAHKQIMSASNSKPSMGLVFNCPASAYLLCTDADADKGKPIVSQFEWDELIETLLIDDVNSRTINKRLKENGIAPRTQRAIFSLCLPANFFYRRKYDEIVDKETTLKREVLIMHGVLVKGTLVKEDVSNKLIQTIHMRYGADITGRFISEAHFILDWYLERRGFSIGLQDCLLDDRKSARKAVKEKIESAIRNVDAVNKTVALTDTEKIFQEEEIQSILDNVLTVGASLAKGSIAGKGNPLGIMVNSGAKGNMNNIAQIGGAIGQQFINAKRPSPNIYGNRTLSYFEADDESVDARGFVHHSFADGLSPADFMFHMAGSRVGLLDTAMRTADIGSINHRSQKVLENDRLDYFGAVINSVYSFTSLCYGEGYSPTELVLVTGFNSTGPMYMPFDLKRMVDELNTTTKPKGNEKKRQLTQTEIEDIVSIIPKVRAVVSTVANHNQSEIVEVISLQLSEIVMYPSAILTLKARMYNRCARADIQPGETVGLHAAEAIGQPITQATLNSFHKAGGADAGNTGAGIFSEILNLSHNRKVKRADIHFKNDSITYEQSIHLARAFRAVSLKSLLTDPIKGIIYRRWKKDEPRDPFYEFFDFISEEPENERKWKIDDTYFLRLTFDPYRLYESRITMADICSTISEGGGVICASSPTRDGIVDVYGRDIIEKKINSKSSKGVGQTMESFVSGEELRETKKEGEKKKRKRKDAPAPSAKFDKMKREQEEKLQGQIIFDDEEGEEGEGEVDKSIKSIKEMTGVTKENSIVLFLQIFLIPKIESEILVVSSSYSAELLKSIIPDDVDKYIPTQARNLSLFRTVEPVIVKTLDVVRDVVKISPTEWKAWFDTQKIYATGVERSKVMKLFKSVFKEAAVFEIGDDGGGDYMKIVFKKHHPKYDNSLLDVIRTSIKDAPTGSDVSINSEYVYIKGRGAVALTLRKMLIHPAINDKYTISNNPHEISEVRGIETARAWVFGEIYNIILNTGSTINTRHIQIIVDVMVSSGTLMPFTARGSVRQQLGAFSESSFEQALQAFKRSAIVGAPEPVTATSTSILVGSVPPFGTGSFRLLPTVSTTSEKMENPISLSRVSSNATSSKLVFPDEDSVQNIGDLNVDSSGLLSESGAMMISNIGKGREEVDVVIGGSGGGVGGSSFGTLSFPPNKTLLLGTLSNRDAAML